MSLDRSLKSANSLVRHRNVLTRAERLDQLADEEKWDDKKSVYGLPKVGHRKQAIVKGGGKEEAVEGATPDAAAAAPAAGAKGAAPAGAEPPAGAKGAAAAPAAGAKGSAPAAKEVSLTSKERSDPASGERRGESIISQAPMRAPSDYISRRAHGVDASGIRKVFDLAAKMKDPINLSIGMPHFDVPDIAKLAAIAAINAGHNRYTQTQGIAPLRERLRKDLSAEIGRDVGEILITSGVSGGLFLTILATLDAGDEAVFLDPYFVMYKHLLTMADAKSVLVDSYPDFRFHADRVERAITPRTKLLLLNSPGNPTGVVMTQAEVAAAVEVARKHDLLLVSDEIYEPFLYEGNVSGMSVPGKSSKPKLISPAAIYDRTIILRGFSKSHAMTGWRLGYAAGPAAIIAQMTKLQQYTFVCAPAPLQYAALKALDIPMDSAIGDYRKKRDYVCAQLSKSFEFVRPDGAFYVFPKAPAGYTASEFVAKAIENNVLIIPGNVFSERDTHFRISYATTDEKLAAGCEILCKLA